MTRLLSSLLATVSLSSALKSRRRSCSHYVKRMKLLQVLKGSDEECSARVRSGKFLCFHKQRPLIRKDKLPVAQVVWVTYQATHHAYSKLKLPLVMENQAVLLNISEDGVGEFALQLHGLDDDKKLAYLEEKFNGSFEDMRLAFTLVSKEDFNSLSKAAALLKWHYKYLFCPLCGTKNVRNTAGSQRVCSSCNTVQYPQVAPCIIVIVVNNDRCLLVRQPQHPPGLYTAIAGFSEIGESFEETVHREVAEEVGLEVQNIEYIKSQPWPLPAASLMIGCLAEVKSDQKLLIDKQELEDAQWFSASAVHSAAEKVKQDPSIIFTQGKGPLLIPPPGPIAHNLITMWLQRLAH